MKITDLKLPKLIKTKEYEGYDIEDLREFFTPSQLAKFFTWFNGQTGGIYKGRLIVYKYDFDRFCINELGLSIG